MREKHMPEDTLTEWGTADQIFARFGLSRSMLYKLAEAGRIKSSVIKGKDDAKKGVRVFGIQSVRELIEANVI
jgi:hypothetical protein